MRRKREIKSRKIGIKRGREEEKKKRERERGETEE